MGAQGWAAATHLVKLQYLIIFTPYFVRGSHRSVGRNTQKLCLVTVFCPAQSSQGGGKTTGTASDGDRKFSSEMAWGVIWSYKRKMREEVNYVNPIVASEEERTLGTDKGRERGVGGQDGRRKSIGGWYCTRTVEYKEM